MLADLHRGDTTIRLSRADVEDMPAIVARLADDVLVSTRDGAGTDEELAPYPRAFRVVDADPVQLLVVACTGVGTQPQVVGTMQLGFLPWLARRDAVRAQIEAVRICSDQRERRLGETMITWVVEQARRRGSAIVQRTSDKPRTDARRLYERLGFVAPHGGLKLSL